MATNPAYLQALNAPATAGRLPAFLDPDEPAIVSVPVPHDFVPSSAADLAVCLSDPMWRICSGVLYKIMVKGDDNDDSDDALVVPFKPNRAQRRLLKRMHSRNIILKARQLGFTTLICIFFLDCALFRKNIRAGIIAHEEDAAKAIFRDKVKFAYEQLPPALREVMPLKRDAAEELLFAHNNSSIRVSTSMRSGTMQYLHISEFGKICAKRPDRAEEVVRGSIPAVPTHGGMLFIESTAEGRSGHFYSMTEKAQKLVDAGRRLTPKEYRFHFFPWWQEANYRMDPDNVVISAADDEYFEKIEGEMGCRIDIEQRAWWVSTRDNDFSGEEESMWQEYPSTPGEAFQVSNKGCYYAVQMPWPGSRGASALYHSIPACRSTPSGISAVATARRSGSISRWAHSIASSTSRKAGGNPTPTTSARWMHSSARLAASGGATTCHMTGPTSARAR